MVQYVNLGLKQKEIEIHKIRITIHNLQFISISMSSDVKHNELGNNDKSDTGLFLQIQHPSPKYGKLGPIQDQLFDQQTRQALNNLAKQTDEISFENEGLEIVKKSKYNKPGQEVRKKCQFSLNLERLFFNVGSLTPCFYARTH